MSFLGIALAVGLHVDVGITVRSLAGSLALTEDAALPLVVEAQLLAALFSEPGKEICAPVAAYACSWWLSNTAPTLDARLGPRTVGECLMFHREQPESASAFLNVDNFLNLGNVLEHGSAGYGSSIHSADQEFTAGQALFGDLEEKIAAAQCMLQLPHTDNDIAAHMFPDFASESSDRGFLDRIVSTPQVLESLPPPPRARPQYSYQEEIAAGEAMFDSPLPPAQDDVPDRELEGEIAAAEAMFDSPRQRQELRTHELEAEVDAANVMFGSPPPPARHVIFDGGLGHEMVVARAMLFDDLDAGANMFDDNGGASYNEARNLFGCVSEVDTGRSSNDDAYMSSSGAKSARSTSLFFRR